MYDIITIGDTTIDMFLAIDDASVQCDLDKDKCKLVLNYASKIPVRHTKRIVGVGNAANHAVGAARLGFSTAIYTQIGDDDCGEDIIKKLKTEKVSTDYVVVEKGTETNYSTIIDYKSDRTILVYHADRKYKLPKFPKPKWIYFSSISGNHEEFNKKLASYVKRHRVKLGFNPGTMQMKLGVKKLAPILEVCEVVFVNKQEAEKLVGKKKDIKKLLAALKNKGPNTVVITDGQKGSYCYDGDTYYHIGIVNSPVVERTGCGDAYASGFIAALQSGELIHSAMRWGSFNAYGVAQEIGSQAGLLTMKEMKGYTSRYGHFKAVVI